MVNIYVFCIYLRTNSDLCHLQHKLIGFYNRDEKCLERGTDWVFKYSGLRLVFIKLIYIIKHFKRRRMKVQHTREIQEIREKILFGYLKRKDRLEYSYVKGQQCLY